MISDMFKSHENSVTDSLDNALNQALGNLPSYSSTSSLSSVPTGMYNLCLRIQRNGQSIHTKTPLSSLCSDMTVTMWLLASHLLVALVEGYKTMYLCHLDSYPVAVCNRYLVSSHVVTVQLPTRCLVDRFIHRPHGSGYLIMCMSDVVTVQ